MTMPEYDFVNPVELSPLILAECRTRVMRDIDEARTSTALAYGLAALYDAATGYPRQATTAEEQLRALAAPLAGCPSSVNWRQRATELREWTGGPLYASFTCPRCGAVSYHPEDVRHGYCGRCHDWTGKRAADA